MAKILEGPLAASLSGRLGPIIFRRTRFGQVVQSASKPRVHSTAAALASKAAFRAGPASYSQSGNLATEGLREAYNQANLSAAGQWNACIMQAIREGRGEPRMRINESTYHELFDLAPGGPTNWSVGQDFIPGINAGIDSVRWVALSPTGQPIWSESSQVLPGPPERFAPIFTPIDPPFVVIALSFSVPAFGFPGPRWVGRIGPALYQP